ncbi:MAG TPA: hypothetical protein VMT60_03055, partial [Candidatus Bathyarchaeia archaeon]|nr:hypothetical protein [Candidatus Bathyarchaeia archaeon]
TLPALVSAKPVTGIYRSTDLGGQLLTGRASTWRPGVNSGLPHVLHMESWNGVLGTQWEISCPTENTNFTVQDNRVGGNGTIVYTSTFQGGAFTFIAGGWPWGDGSGTLNTSTLITTVQYMMIGGVSTPVASVVNGNSSGVFADGCTLVFAIANGSGDGETPYLQKPATYPTFLDGTCGPASGNAQFGTWGTVITITMGINCPVGAEGKTWGVIKDLYR